MALETSSALAFVYLATTSLWEAGFGWVKGGVAQSCEGDQPLFFACPDSNRGKRVAFAAPLCAHMSQLVGSLPLCHQ